MKSLYVALAVVFAMLTTVPVWAAEAPKPMNVITLGADGKALDRGFAPRSNCPTCALEPTYPQHSLGEFQSSGGDGSGGDAGASSGGSGSK